MMRNRMISKAPARSALDDDSQEDLATNGWAAGFYAQGQQGDDVESRPRPEARNSHCPKGSR